MEKVKAFQVRLPHEMWTFLKRKSIDREMSMNDIIQQCLNKYKKSCENKLTDVDTSV